MLFASITFSTFYSAAPSRSLSSVVLKDVTYLFINQHNYIAFGARSVWQFCLLSCSALYTSTPEGGTALLQDAQRQELNSPSVPANAGKHMCMCKGSFVWSLTGFLPPHCGGVQSIFKSSLKLAPGLIYTESSDLGIIWEPFKHTNAPQPAPSQHCNTVSETEEKRQCCERSGRCLLGKQVGMVVVIGEFVKERAWLQDEGGQHHPGQVHAGPQLLQQDPHQALVLLRDGFCLRWFTCLQREKGSSGQKH